MADTQDQQKPSDDMRAQILEGVITEAREIIDHLNLCLIQLDQDLNDEALIDTITRGFHTMKGSAGFAELDQLVTIAKAFEMSMREVKKGAVSLTSSAINLLYDALDAIAAILDKAEANDFTEIEATQLIEKVERFKSGKALEATSAPEEDIEAPSGQFDELLKIYRDGYNQLTALKHLMFSSLHLHDPETLAVVLSKQIHDRIGALRNSLWLIDQDTKIIETARNGKLVEKEDRRIFRSADSEIFQRILHEQLIHWPTDPAVLQADLPEYESPVIFPIKMKTEVLGLLILDLKEQVEIELFQFITQFAAMMMHNSQLHLKVAEQRVALDEMTEILFRQNAHLSAMHHIEMMLLNEEDAVKQCQVVVDALVSELDTMRAAAFIYYPSKQEFLCAAQSGGFKDIVGTRYPLTQIRALQEALETGRLIAHVDYGETLTIGTNPLEMWIALGIKGRKKTHGVLVVELGEEEFSDAVSIIAQFLGVLLDNFLKKQKATRSES